MDTQAGTSAPSMLVFDLDGTLLDTESLVFEVASEVLLRHGATLTTAAFQAGVGRRPLDAWRAVAEALALDVPAQQLFDESEPLLQDRWHGCRLMPGVQRLLKHLTTHHPSIPLAIVTSTPMHTYKAKMTHHASLANAFSIVITGDAVTNGKPAPDGFLAAAAQAQVDPATCLVVEDAQAGVQAALAAGMRVVAVPSSADVALVGHERLQVLPSLLQFAPEHYGLAPFGDTIEGCVPLDPPLCLQGPVVRGFGRGSRELGIKTANLDADALAGSLADAVTGIFAGWARIGDDPTVYKTALSIGYNPHFANKVKTAEPWILHDFGDRQFYGEHLRVLVCAFIRPETAFTSLQALIDQIHNDGTVASAILDHPSLASLSRDSFLCPPTPCKGNVLSS